MQIETMKLIHSVMGGAQIPKILSNIWPIFLKIIQTQQQIDDNVLFTD